MSRAMNSMEARNVMLKNTREGEIMNIEVAKFSRIFYTRLMNSSSLFTWLSHIPTNPVILSPL